MNLKPVSYNGHNINDGTAYTAALPGIGAQSQFSIGEVNRPDMAPGYAGKTYGGAYFPLQIKAIGTPVYTYIDTLKGYFNPDINPSELLAGDSNNSSKQWFVNAVPTLISRQSGPLIEYNMYAADPIWQAKIPGTTTWTIGSSGALGTIVTTGNQYAFPSFEITPTSAGGVGFAYRRWVALYSQANRTMKNYPVNICGTTLDTASLGTASKCGTLGYDMRVYEDGAETPRWFRDFNSGTTKIWIVSTWKPGQSVTSGTITAGQGTAITFQNTTANITALANIAKWGGKSFVMYVGTEAVIFSNAVIDGRKVTATITRAGKGTSAAAYPPGTVWHWCEHDVWLYYGNATMDAPVQDDSLQPIFDLTSTNTSWVYTSFADASILRAGSWTPALLDTDNKRDTDYCSQIYTGVQLAMADPATEMGMSIQAFRSNSAWKAEQASLVWVLAQPCGGTAITVVGEKYRYTTSWPSATMQKSTDGSTWSTVWTDVTPGTVQTWEALAAHGTVSLGTAYWMRFRFSGPQPAVGSAQANYSIQGGTIALTTAYTPYVLLGAEQSCYHMQATITNNTTTEAITLNIAFPLNTKLTIDTDGRTCSLADGTNMMPGLSWSNVRRDWLHMLPGTNIFQYDDASTNGVTIKVILRDRNSQ
jgi:hypothetical protein